MTAAVLLISAIGCVGAAFVLLRSLGARYRVGRLLAATPLVTIDRARELAAQPARYVRVNGRISSEEEFPDENDRPLVFRRKRIEVSDGRGGWRTLADEREAVPFGVETRDAFVAVDDAAIETGLVAIPREAGGRLSDLPDDVLAGIDDVPRDTPARLVIEQLSAVEHATVCGTPVLRDGQPMMTAGAGRPLIVTTLDESSAMRLLASGNRGRVLGATVLLVAAAGLAIVALVVFATSL